MQVEMKNSGSFCRPLLNSLKISLLSRILDPRSVPRSVKVLRWKLKCCDVDEVISDLNKICLHCIRFFRWVTRYQISLFTKNAPSDLHRLPCCFCSGFSPRPYGPPISGQTVNDCWRPRWRVCSVWILRSLGIKWWQKHRRRQGKAMPFHRDRS